MVLTEILDRLQLVHLFLLNFLFQTSSSSICFISQRHHQLLGYWTQNLEVVFSCYLSLVPNIKSVTKHVGGTSVMSARFAPFFFMTVRIVASRSMYFLRDPETTRSCPVCTVLGTWWVLHKYFLYEKKSTDGGAFPAQTVLPVLPPLLGGRFFLVPVSCYSIWPSRFGSFTSVTFFLCFRAFCLFLLIVLAALCLELQSGMSDLPPLCGNFLRAGTRCY